MATTSLTSARRPPVSWPRQPPSSGMDLPTETLYAIFEHLQPHPSHLAQVARVCRRFRWVAEHILYAHILVQESLPRSSPFPHRTQRCCETLLVRSDLHDAVRRFTVRWQTDISVRKQYEPFVQPVLSTLNSALRMLIHLEALDLALDVVGVPVPLRTLLDRVRLPSLRLFALYGMGPGSIPVKHCPDTLVLQQFLAATRTLEHLMLGDHYSSLELASVDLPLLSAFKGTATAAASVIPGRAVHHLALVGQDQIPPPTLAELARGRTPVRTLDLSAVSVTPNTLKDISQYLRGVDHLKVRFALRHTLHHSFTGIVSGSSSSPSTAHLPSVSLLCPCTAVPDETFAPTRAIEHPRRARARFQRSPSAATARPLCDPRAQRRARHVARGGKPLPDVGSQLPVPPLGRLSVQDGVDALRPRAHLGVQVAPAIHEELG